MGVDGYDSGFAIEQFSLSIFFASDHFGSNPFVYGLCHTLCHDNLIGFAVSKGLQIWEAPQRKKSSA